jgi:hypothetical protein
MTSTGLVGHLAADMGAELMTELYNIGKKYNERSPEEG